MLKIVQLEDWEWPPLEAVLDAAHKLRLRSEAGDYKGSMQNPKEIAAAHDLAEDLKALIDASKAARPASD